MALQVKPVLGFKTQSDQQIATTASAVIKEMTGNPAFPNPPVELKAVQAAVDELNAVMAAQVQGGTAATAVKKNKRDSVVTLLRKLAHYVHDNCGNDPAVLLSRRFSTGNQQPGSLSAGEALDSQHRSRQQHGARSQGKPNRE